MALTSTSSCIFRQIHQGCRNPTATRLIANLVLRPARLLCSSAVLRNKALSSKLHGFFNASDKKMSRLQVKDGVPNNYTLIYKAPMELYMKYGYPTTLIFTLASPAIMLYDFYVHGKIFMAKEAHSIPFFNPEKEIWIFTGALVLFAWALFAVMFKYPLRVYKHKDKQQYVAIFLSAVPLRVRQFYFQRATGKKFWNPFYSFVDDSCHYFLDNKKKALLYGHYFRTPADLSEMEGWYRK